VRYLLEGSVQRSAKQVRINAQLIDAESNAHLWAERFDRDINDLFALQNEITGRIAVALGSELVIAEAARPTEHPEALDYIFRGRAAMNKPPARDNYAEAIGLFEHALALDPRSVEAQSWLAIALARRVLDQMSDSTATDIARAQGLVGQALAALPGSPLAHFAKGDLLVAQRQFAEAIPEYETVLAANRNSVDALAIIGRQKINIGMIDEAIPFVEQAIRLSPRDPRWLGIWYLWIAQANLLRSRTDEAILWLEKARSANPAHPKIHLYLAAAYALKGETARAAAELAEARRLVGDDRFSSIARLHAADYLGVPNVRALFEATYFAGLRKAGVPEE
jgi:adenylate cyclase